MILARSPSAAKFGFAINLKKQLKLNLCNYFAIYLDLMLFPLSTALFRIEAYINNVKYIILHKMIDETKKYVYQSLFAIKKSFIYHV